MTLSPSPWHPENEVERLLCSLAGVVSARVVANPLGRLDEIHILASPHLSPKQVVRNVESALSAGLGIVIDRRIVSVAQIRRDALEAGILDDPDIESGPRPATPSDAAMIPANSGADAAAEAMSAADRATVTPQEASAAAGVEPPAEQRYEFVGYDAYTRGSGESTCRVTIRRNGETFTGEGAGAGTQQGRAFAGARAVFAALESAHTSGEVGLENVSVVETHGRTYVLVAARALAGRHARPLTGVAPVLRSPEEAAILASLQATNRWTGVHS